MKKADLDKKVEWACPKCKALANHCGRGGVDACKDDSPTEDSCQGLLCECEDEAAMDLETHGESLREQCANALCYHCGWSGPFPQKPPLKGWQLTAWKAGWRPVESE